MTDNKEKQLRESLANLEEKLKDSDLWQDISPAKDKLESNEPFALDNLSAHEWLQWIFIPKMHLLLETKGPLPNQIALIPYLEEAMKEEAKLPELLAAIRQIENIILDTQN